jgi:hypothetical protein
VAVSPEHPVHPPVRRVRPAVLDLPARPRPGASLDAYGGRIEGFVDAAVAVLAVTAELVRYAAERGVRARGPLLPRPSSLRRALATPLGRVLTHPASAAVRAISAAADVVVPELAEAVLTRLDVVAIVREHVDLDRLATLLDVDAVVARVDLDAVLDRVDVDAIAARLDLNTVVEKVDITRVIDRVDLDEVVARVDIERVLGQVDLDGVVARVDLDRAVDRVDIDRVLARTDLAGLARYLVDVVDLPGLLRASTATVTTEMVRGVRDQGADADRAVERVVDRLLHRHGRRAVPEPDPPEVPA